MSAELTDGMRLVPDNFGPLKNADASARFTGPCGDTMEFWLQIAAGRVERCTYTTDGCHHSVLSGSAAARLAVGRTLAEIDALTPDEVFRAAGELPAGHGHCAKLAARTLKLAAADYVAPDSSNPARLRDLHLEEKSMRIAIPVTGGMLSQHFGHCEQFVIFDADTETGDFNAGETLTPPVHEPGLLPRWLGEKKVDVVIAGGMGQRAVSLFTEQGIKVITGAASLSPAELAAAYLAGRLQTGDNACDH